MPEHLDYPLEEVAGTAGEVVAIGGTVHQKFTCRQCGERVMIEEPNVFYATGRCDECGALTNLRETGCNYLVILGKGELRRSP